MSWKFVFSTVRLIIIENTAWDKAIIEKSSCEFGWCDSSCNEWFFCIVECEWEYEWWRWWKLSKKVSGYLKSLYPAKCTAGSLFRTRSTSFALSDNSDLDLMEKECCYWCRMYCMCWTSVIHGSSANICRAKRWWGFVVWC